MIPVKQIDPEDLPLYAMQLLPPEEMEEMTANLQYSREGRQRLAELYEELAMYAHSVELQTPSGAAKQKLVKQVGREKKVVPIDRQAPAPVAAPTTVPVAVAELAPRGLGARAMPWIGWAVAAALAFEAIHLYQQKSELNHTVAMEQQELSHLGSSAEVADAVLGVFQDPAAQNVVLTSSAVKPPPQGRVAYSPEKGSLVFLATNLAAVSADRIYELWLIPADGRAPIPAGTFRPNAQGYASVLLPQLPKGVVAGQFGVTVEPARGSTVPTFPIVLGGKPA